MDRKKIIALLVLAVFIISALPLAIASNGNGNGNGQGSDDSIEEAEDEDVNETEDLDETEIEVETETGAGITAKLRINATNVDACVNIIKEKRPNLNEQKIRTACEYSFRLRTAVGANATKWFNQGRVQRFIAQKGDVAEKFLAKIEEKHQKVIQKLDRARLKNCLEDTNECQEKLKEWNVKTDKVKNIVRQRVIAQNKLLEAQNKFLQAKNKYMEMKNNQLRARNEFLGLKAQLAQCLAEGGNCSALENQTFEKAQEDLLALADRLIQHMEKVKSRVESAENLNETEAQEMIDSIDEMIAKLEEAKDMIEAATNQDELKEGIQIIREVWADIKVEIFQYAEEVIHSRVGEIFVRSELLEKKLEDVVERLQAKGVDTTDIEDKLDEFSAKIDEARTKMTEANKLFAEAKELRGSGDKEGAKEKLEEAKALTREAHQALKDAHKILMELVRMINQSGAIFDPDEVNEEEEVELVEEEDE
ncbi:hypothetical protein JW756_03535 [Candidatus Woesearchaeota archaeon]|nr:hypothetical protein [Candidatus Woesearchaeota archaeon]